jgi:hypothetical protein
LCTEKSALRLSSGNLRRFSTKAQPEINALNHSGGR